MVDVEDPGARMHGRVRLSTLQLMRWVAVAGQTAAILVVHFGLGFSLPIVPAILVVAVSAGLNLAITLRRPRGAWIGEREAALYLVYDLAQLAVLLALTGGLTNPFAVLILAPITVSASLLSRKATALLALVGLVLVSLLAFVYLPLPWSAVGVRFQPLYLLGLWAGLVFAILFIAVYVYSIGAEAQRMSDALAATRDALAREQQLSALGALAAAAAHELGTPLATIQLVAKEMARELPEDSPLAEDANLLVEESQRCKDILARLAHDPRRDGGQPFNFLPLTALVEAAAAPFARDDVALAVEARPPEGESAEDQPLIQRSPELLHGLGTLIQNAVQFAATRVDIDVSWDREEVRVAIRDDGPGFAPGVIAKLGQPYVGSGRNRTRQGEGHSGLGIFIAEALLGRHGGRIAYANAAGGGANVVISWKRATLEPELREPQGTAPPAPQSQT